MTAIHNDNRFDKLTSLAKKLGASEGSGATSRAELFRQMFLAASQSYLTSNLENKSLDQVEPIVTAYWEQRALKNPTDQTEEPKKLTGLISKFRNAATVGGMAVFRQSRNGGNTIAEDFLKLCDARITHMATVNKSSPPVFLKLVKIMTDQKAKVKKLGTEEPMTEAEIDLAIADKETEPSELKDLRAIQSKLVKFGKAWPDAHETTNAALDTINKRLALLEGAVNTAALAETLASFTPEQIAAALAAKQAA